MAKESSRPKKVTLHAEFLTAHERKLQERIKLRKNQLRQLGVKRSQIESKNDKMVVSEQQAKAIELLIDFEGNHSPDYIAGQVGCATRTYHNWRNDPVFMKELDKQITLRKTRMRHEAWRLLFKRIKAGNPKILKMYFEMIGDLQKNINLKEEQVTAVLNEADVDAELAKLTEELGLDNASKRIN
jgi:hypothetical protein